MLPSLIIIYIIVYNVTRTNNSNHIIVTTLCPHWLWGYTSTMQTLMSNPWHAKNKKKIEVYPAQPVCTCALKCDVNQKLYRDQRFQASSMDCIMIVKSSMLFYKFYTLWVLNQNLAHLYQTWQLRQVQGACFGVNKCNNWMHGVLSHIWHTQLYNNFIPGYIIYQWYMQTILWRLEHL